MTVALPHEGDSDDLLSQSGEHPLGGEAMPSTQAVEAIQAAAAEAQAMSEANAYVAGGDMCQETAKLVRKALRKDIAPKKDLFGEEDDPHLTDAARIAASFREMAVIGTEDDDQINGENPGDAAAPESNSGPISTRPIGSISLRSLAPMLGLGRNNGNDTEKE